MNDNEVDRRELGTDDRSLTKINGLYRLGFFDT